MMNGFPAIRFKEIISFYEVMNSIYEPTVRNVQRRFEDISNRFSLVLQFLSEIKMLQLVDDEIQIKYLNEYQSRNIGHIKEKILEGAQI